MYYTEEKQIGEGTYGKVYAVRCQKTRKRLALKKVQREEGYGIPFTTIREINMLKSLKHENITRLLETHQKNNTVSLLFDYAEYDLAGLNSHRFTDKQLRSISYQLLSAVTYMHSLGIIHRDIKSSNILLTSNGTVKMADFGLARQKTALMTNRVCTLWYRAPELLLGCCSYDQKIDMWSVGCVISEMATKSVLFKTEDEISQIKKIASIFGPPKREYPWSHILKLWHGKEHNMYAEFITFLNQHIEDDLLEIVLGLLQVDSDARIDAPTALEHPALAPFAGTRFSLNINDIHEFTSKKSK